MKKILALVALVAIVIASCSKGENTKISVAYSPSYPIVKITSDTFFTIPVLGALPTVTATAYDTFYKKSLDSLVFIDYSAVDVTTPGFYLITVSAKNQIGYIGYAYGYVSVVTTVSALFNFTGRYKQQTNGDTVYVTSKLDRNGNIIPGFYNVDNVAGVHSSYDSINYITPAFFAQLSNTQIVLPAQYTPLGLLKGINASCIVASADTAFQYQVINADFGASMRVFKRF